MKNINNMKSRLILVVFAILICTTALYSQDYNLGEPEHLLDGRSFNYQYQNQTAVHIEFKEGMVVYKWIKGPNAANPIRTFLYLSRRIDDGIYSVQWHEKELNNFITLIFNFNVKTVASSAIIKYGLESQFTTFNCGFISQLEGVK